MAATTGEYLDYVGALAADIPRLRPLRDFLRQAAPVDVQPDNINVFDVSTSGVLQREQFHTTNDSEGKNDIEALMQKLGSTSPDLGLRVISVSHLTPSAVGILGSQFDLSADFFSAHLPNAGAHLSTELGAGSLSAFHIDLYEIYHLENPRAISSTTTKRRVRNTPEGEDPDLRRVVHVALDHQFLRPWVGIDVMAWDPGYDPTRFFPDAPESLGSHNASGKHRCCHTDALPIAQAP